MTVIPDTGCCLGFSGVDGKPDRLPESAVFLEQIHSNLVVLNPAGGESADGMIMDKGFGIPALRVADCLPVFALWDDYMGAAHAGWRGLAKGIIENLLTAVDQPLRWFITGPCICGNCYAVGDDVRSSVISGDPVSGISHPEGRIDLRGSAVARARNLCDEDFRVLNTSGCTLESAGLYSYRENKTVRRNYIWLAEIEQGLHIRQLNN
jgi:copper oxidase (laccase) domain-containing protein